MGGLPVNVNGSWKDGKPFVNVNGSWKQVFANFNKATGGTVTDVDNYNGTGQTWRVHTFTSGGTFNIEKNAQPFKVLVCGAGQHGGAGTVQDGGGGAGGGGHGGKYLHKSSQSLSTGGHAVTVGTNYGASALGSLSSSNGSNGGNANSHGVTFDITGSSVGYCGGGGNGGYGTPNGSTSDVFHGAPGYDGGGGGGAAQPDYVAYYGPGGKGVRGGGGGGGAGANSFQGSGSRPPGGSTTGVVIIAYQIG